MMEIRVHYVDEVEADKRECVKAIRTFFASHNIPKALAFRAVDLMEDVPGVAAAKGHPAQLRGRLGDYMPTVTSLYGIRQWLGYKEKPECSCGICRITRFYKENGIAE